MYSIFANFRTEVANCRQSDCNLLENKSRNNMMSEVTKYEQ